MAVANTKSPEITAFDSTPNDLAGYRRRQFTTGGLVSTVAADDDGSVYRVTRVPSNATYLGSRVTNGAVTSGTDFDFGIYRTAADGGAVVDKDCIHDGIDMSSARAALTALAQQAGTNIGKKFYELAGLSTDPGVQYDLCWTANTVGSGATHLITYVDWSMG